MENNLFANRFTELLKESNKTYEEIALDLGFKSKGTISKYANGKNKNVTISTVMKISKYFDVSPVWLIGLTNNIHYVIKNKNK